MKKKINEENLNHSESTVNNDLKRRVFSLFSVLFDCFFVFTFFWLRLQGSQNETKFLKTISACLLDCSKHYRNCYLFLSFFSIFFPFFDIVLFEPAREILCYSCFYFLFLAIFLLYPIYCSFTCYSYCIVLFSINFLRKLCILFCFLLKGNLNHFLTRLLFLIL